jgi:hypothetical protein
MGLPENSGAAEEFKLGFPTFGGRAGKKLQAAASNDSGLT